MTDMLGNTIRLSTMKSLLKHCAAGIAFVCVLPVLLLYWMSLLVGSRQSVFAGYSQAIALLPGMTGVCLRRAFYRMTLDRAGRDASIGFGTIFSHPTAELGERVYVGAYCVLGDVTLEDDVLLASGVSIANGRYQHGIDRADVPIREQTGDYPRVTIGRDTWIGERAVVLADVGEHCVIGAGAVVIEPIPDHAVSVGVPAKVVRFRNKA